MIPKYFHQDKLFGFDAGVNKTATQMIEQQKLKELKKQMLDYHKYALMDSIFIDELNNKKPVETEEQKVLRILKGDFERQFGMTFDRFIEVRERMLETNPERFI